MAKNRDANKLAAAADSLQMTAFQSERERWQIYNKFKQRLREQNLSEAEYQQRINDALGVLGL